MTPKEHSNTVKGHGHSNASGWLWGLIALLAALVALRALVGVWRPPLAGDPATTFLEATRPIVVRVYANTPTEDHFILASDDGSTCQVDREEWLNSYIGQPHSCIWKNTKPPR